MADQNLNFIIEFQAAEKSLKGLRADFEKAVQNIPSSIKTTVEKATSGSKGGLVSGISKLTKESIDAQKKLNLVIKKRTDNLDKIQTLEDKNFKTSSLAEVAALIKARKAKGGFTSSVNRAAKTFDKISDSISPSLNLLLSELGVFTRNVKVAAGLVDSLPIDKILELPQDRPHGAPRTLPKLDDIQILAIDFEPLKQEVTKADKELRKFRERIAGVQNIGGIDQSFGVLGNTVNKTVRVLENAATAAPGLATELRRQAEAIRKTSSASNQLTDAQTELIRTLLRGAANVEDTLSRPIESLSGRAADLGIAFGTIAKDMAKELSPIKISSVLIDGVRRFGLSLDEAGNELNSREVAKIIRDGALKYRRALEDAGGDVEAASRSDAVTGGGPNPEASADFIRAYNAALRKSEQETLALADSSKQLINAQDGLASKISKTEAISQVNEITKEFNKSISVVGKQFIGLGKAAGKAEGGFSDLPAELSKFKNRLFDAVGPGNLQGLKDVGVNVDDILEKFINRAGENFVKEFKNTTDRLEREFLKISVKDFLEGKISLDSIQFELQSKFGRTAGQAAEATNKIFKSASEKLGSQIVKDAEKRKQETDKRLEVNKKLSDVRRRVIVEEERLLKAISDSVRNENLSRKFKGKSASGAKSGPSSLKIDDLQKFGSQLNTKQQEVFVSLLKRGETNLKKINTQLKAHQGNIGKSNNLVENLTRTMTSGQRAAFQFGFAASNAAERLTAWASPAALIFAATSSLRNAVSQIVQLDTEIARIAFFDAETLDKIASGIQVQGVALKTTAASAEDAKGAFDRLNTSTERLAVLNKAAARSQEVLIKRAKETGVELSKLTEIALVSGRVGKQAFDDSGQITPFARAVEGIVRLEGASANAADITAKLNSVINQFGLEAQDATVLAAQLTEASRRTAFGAADLAEGMTRVAGAFSTLQRATPQETLEFLAVAGNTAQVSVSKVGTALRQFSVGVAKAAKDVKEFSGLDIVDADGLLRGPEALVEVLGVISTFEGSEAAIEFIKQFTDERNASIILSLARGTEELAVRLDELSSAGGEAAAKQRALLGFLAAVDAQSQTLSSQLEKVKSSVTELVATSGFIEFLSGGASAINDMVGGFTEISKSIGGFVGVFGTLAALAIPTLQRIAQGFVAGFLGKQQLAAVQSKFTVALLQEKNLVEAIGIAEAQRLISEKEAATFRKQALSLTVKQFAIEREIHILTKEIEIIERAEIADAERLIVAKGKLNVLEAERLAILRGEAPLSKSIQASAEAGATKQKGLFGELLTPDNLTRVLVTSAIIAGPLMGKAIGKSVGGEVGKELEGAFSGAASGIVLGSILGPIGAAIGGIIGAIGGLVSAYSAANERAKVQLETEIELERSIRRQKRIQEARNNDSLIARGRITNAQIKLNALQGEQEILELKINAAKDKSSEKSKLQEKSLENQVKINRILLQQKKLEAAQVDRQLKFEERIVEIKKEQNVLSNINNLIQKAQIALLSKNKDKPILEIEIKAETDDRNLDIIKQRVQKELDAVEIRLAQVGARNGGADIQKKLSKQQKTLQAELLDLDIKRADVLLDSAVAVRDVRRGEADAELNTFKSIGSLLRAEFKTFTDNQLKVVNIIGRQADVFKELAKNQEELVTNAARASTKGGVSDISDLSIKKQLEIIKKRNNIVEKGAINFNKVLIQQLESLGEVASLEELGERSASIALRFANLGGPMSRFAEVVSTSDKILREKLEVDRSAFESAKAISLKNIDLNRQRIARENDVARQKIALINEEIDVLRKRIDLETRLGEELINTPEKFFKETKKVFNARDILRQVGADSGNIEESLLKIISKVRSTTGISGLKPIFEGLKAAQERGTELVAGVLPKELSSLFARLVISPNAKLQEARLTKQETLIKEISTLVSNISSNNEKLNAFIEVEKEIQTLLRADESSENQIAAIAGGFFDQQAKMTEANGILASTSKTLANVATNVVDLKTEFLGAIKVTEGDIKIETAVNAVRDVLEELASVNEKVISNRSGATAELASQFAKKFSQGPSVADTKLGNARVIAGNQERNKQLRTLAGLAQEQREKLAKIQSLQERANKINEKVFGKDSGFTDIVSGILTAFSENKFFGEGGSLVGAFGEQNKDFKGAPDVIPKSSGAGRVSDISDQDKEARDKARKALERYTAEINKLEQEIKIEGIKKGFEIFNKGLESLGGSLKRLGVDTDALKARADASRRTKAAGASVGGGLGLAGFGATSGGGGSAIGAIKAPEFLFSVAPRLPEPPDERGAPIGAPKLPPVELRKVAETLKVVSQLLRISNEQLLKQANLAHNTIKARERMFRVTPVIPKPTRVPEPISSEGVSKFGSNKGRVSLSPEERTKQNRLVENIIRSRKAGDDLGIAATPSGGDPSVLAKQIANMERILERGRAGKNGLDDKFLNNLERQIEQLTTALQLATGGNSSKDIENAKRNLEASKKTERDSATRRAAEKLKEEEKTARERAKRREERKATKSSKKGEGSKSLRNENKKNAEKIVDAGKDAEKKQKENSDKVSGSVDEVAKRVDEMSSKMIGALNKLGESLKGISSGSTGLLKIDPASREDFCNCIKEAIRISMENWTQQFSTAVEDGVLDIRVSPVDVFLQANVTSIIEGQTFADQLVEALIGTGLEDRVSDIQEALAEVLKLEQERSGRVGNGGAKVLDGAGGGSQTRRSSTQPRIR